MGSPPPQPWHLSPSASLGRSHGITFSRSVYFFFSVEDLVFAFIHVMPEFVFPVL